VTTAREDTPAAAGGGSSGERIVVLHLESPNRGRQGDHIYRTSQPCRALGGVDNVTVVSGSLLSPAIAASGLLDNADVLVMCDVVDADFLPVIDARRRQRRLSGYEVNDNFLAPQSWNPTAYLASNLVSRSLSSQLARQSDFLQSTVAELDRRFAHLNPRRVVFPNQLWEMPAPIARPAAAAGAPVTIGWGGSFGHRDDLKWSVPALRAVIGRHPEARLAIMGDPTFCEMFAWVPQERFAFTPAGNIDAYYNFLRQVDIGLAPLLPTDFNRCRSDIKFLEYAAHGVLAICSDLEPYRGAVENNVTGFLVDGAASLEAALDRAIGHPEERRAIAERALRTVAAGRLERPHARDRLAFYLATATQLGFVARTRWSPVDLQALDELPDGARTFAGSHYFALGEGETERLLYDGLRLQQSGDPIEARRCFLEARSRAPRFYIPELFLGGVEPDPGQALACLQRALALNPRSCNAAFMIGAHLQASGDKDGAVSAFRRCRDLAPGFGAPQARLAEMAEAAGRLDEACALYEESALANGGFALPVARLAVIALRDGRFEKAVAMLEQSLQQDPGLWLTNFLVGRAYVELKRFHQARVHLQRALETAEDRAAVLAQLAKAEIGLGNVDAARAAMEEIKRLGATGGRPH
jgi:tetratricopeptide (TPR) repeat protein